MAVKVPPLLHQRPKKSQIAWYKANKMPLPPHLTGEKRGKDDGYSAAQAKKDVGEINKEKAKKKAREAAIAAAAQASKKNKELVSSSERVREMGRRRRESGEGLGGGLETNRDILSYVRAGGTIKAGRLGEAAKPDASMIMTDTLKNKMITDKDKQTLGKVADLMRSLRNKDKKNQYVRKVGLDAMNAGKVDPARGHSPTRFGREQLRKEEIEMNEGKMKDIVTDREETARLAAQEKEPPFTPDKKKVRRGPGGPMSNATWLAKQAMMKAIERAKMKKEEVEQIHEMYGGKVNGKRFDYQADEHELEDDDKLHDAIASQNDHLDRDEVEAIVRSNGYSRKVKVRNDTHRVEHDDNPFNEEVESVEEGLLDKAKTVAKNISGIVNPKTPEEKAKSIQRKVMAKHYTSIADRDDANRKWAGMKPLTGVDRLKMKAGGLKRAAQPYVKAALKGVREEAEQTDEAIRVKDISVSNTLGSLKKAKPSDNFILKDRAQMTRDIAASEVKDIRKKTMGNPEARKAALKRADYAIAKEEVELIEQDDTMEKKEMAQTQLHFMKYAAEEILEFIKMGGEIEEWYQNKLSKVHSDMEGLHSYIEGEKRRTGMVEEMEQVDEGKKGKVTIRYEPDLGKKQKPAGPPPQKAIEKNLRNTYGKGTVTIEPYDEYHLPDHHIATHETRDGETNSHLIVPPKHNGGHWGIERSPFSTSSYYGEEVEQFDEEHSHLATFVPKKGSEAKDHISIPVNAKDGKKSHEAKFSKIFGKNIANDYELHRVTEKKKMSEALDPVGKEDADIDNDGDTDKTDVYLHRKRKAIGAAIKKKVAEKMGKKQ